jgi:translin
VRIAEIVSEINRTLKLKDERRERLISYSREVIRRSGSTILAIHRGDSASAAENLEAARQALHSSLEVCRDQPEYLYLGALPQAMQEFAEASIVMAVLRGEDLPTPEEVGVPPEAYIAGLADAVGEMRRYALDSLRKDNMEEAERMLKVMEEVYVSLKGLDYPRAVVPNLKRRVDMIRRQVEETRADVTLAHHGRLIRGSIERAMDRLKGGGA